MVELDDADVEMATHLATVGKFLHQGQLWIVAYRIVVMDAVHGTFMGNRSDSFLCA